MYQELIELLYENEAVEAVALFTDQGHLIENQLAISESTITQVCASLVTIKNGLAGSNREMKGFLVKTQKYTLQAYVHSDLLILLQVSSNFSINKTYHNIQSQLGQKTYSPASGDAQAVSSNTQTEVAQSEQAEYSVEWDDFRQKLATLIKRIAPSGVANKMIDTSMKEAGYADSPISLPFENAVAIGQSVVAKIPNASRRKLIDQEFQVLAEQFAQQ
ncbi:hypothetical protein [Rubritalea sp.]|uniref:hypothetical protein n=1 Tax=Rubritalea sp. TaxID=2109375 RepID=UPI003EF98318